MDLNGNESGPSSPLTVTGLPGTVAGEGFVLNAATPIPFHSRSVVSFEVPEAGAVVRIRVFDAAGRLVRTLSDGFQGAGTHTVAWNGRRENGEIVAAGLYYIRMDAASFARLQRVLFIPQ